MNTLINGADTESYGVLRSPTPGLCFPVMQGPGTGSEAFMDWMEENGDQIASARRSAGAVLIRETGLASVAEFERAASLLCPHLYAEYGDLPLAKEKSRVYNATPYPADRTILFHNESSHLDQWPQQIFFFCLQPAAGGGETPIVDCRRVYTQIDPGVKRQFVEKGLMYVRHFTTGIDTSWQESFRTADRETVEQHCARTGIHAEWGEDGDLRTRQVRRAVVRHSTTGESVFFNQLLLYHPACLEPDVRECLGELFPENDFPRTAYFGDGSRISDSAVEEILGVYEQNAVSFRWQAGDLLALDNVLTAHARRPYIGARQIVVTMGEMTSC